MPLIGADMQMMAPIAQVCRLEALGVDDSDLQIILPDATLSLNLATPATTPFNITRLTKVMTERFGKYVGELV